MKIDFESQLHKDLYVRVNKKNHQEKVAIWESFLKKYPEFNQYYSQWINSRMPDSTPLSLLTPWITYPSIKWLSTKVRYSDNIFEWGMGGSTVFLATKCRQIISIDHDVQWFGKAESAIKKHVSGSYSSRIKRWFRDQVKPKQILIDCLERPQNAKSNVLSGASGYENLDFSEYVNQICSFPENYFDFILVDGRARMDCFEKAILHCRPGGYIILDNSDYERYSNILHKFESKQLKGWQKSSYLGPGPSSSYIGWRTTVYQKPI